MSSKTRRAAPSREPAKSARERILDTAEELFYREGIRAIGIDTVIERSGVAKMSLYRNFASKEELIAAFLERRGENYWLWWDEIMARHPESPARQLEGLFAALPKRICRPGYRGCSFLNAATEFPETGHLGRRAALAHYQELRQRLLALCRRLKARKPKQLADQLLLLIEGAYTAAGILGYRDAAKSVAQAAAELIRSQHSPA